MADPYSLPIVEIGGKFYASKETHDAESNRVLIAKADAEALAAETARSTAADEALAGEVASKAAAADLLAEVAARAALVEQSAGYQTDDLVVFVDAEQQVVARVDKGGAWHLVLGTLARADGLALDVIDYNGTDGLAIVDQAGQVLAMIFGDGGGDVPAEVVAARGSRSSLNARLSQALSPAGYLRLDRAQRDSLRQLRQRQARILRGDTIQINHALIGDSFTQNAARWSGPFAVAMIQRYGDGGGGWTGYGYQGAYSGPYTIGGAQPGLINGNARPNLYPVRYQGAWDRVTLSSSPDMIYVTAPAGAFIRREVPAAPDHTALRLIWIGTADGVVRWRVDAGGWTALPVQGGLDTIQHADLPLTPGAHVVEIEVVSGTVKLCGDNALSAAPGYRVHKIARSGSRAANWVDQNEAEQRAGWQLLEVNAWTVMDGTNSQTTPGQTNPGPWQDLMREWVARMRAASTAADICIFMPPENQRTNNAYPMADYADAARDLAWEMDCAFLDAQTAFGPNPAVYGSGGAFPLFSPDLIHPDPTTGGTQLASLALDFHDFSKGA